MVLIPWRPKESWWDPFSDLETMRSDLARLFDHPLAGWGARDTSLLEGAWSPAIDIYDSKDNVLVKIDVPGMSKDELDVTVHGDTLFIKGEKKQEQETKDKGYVRTERFYGAFNRAVRLPADVDTAGAKSSYKNGVLELTLPKKEEAKPKEIKIDIK